MTPKEEEQYLLKLKRSGFGCRRRRVLKRDDSKDLRSDGDGASSSERDRQRPSTTKDYDKKMEKKM